MSPTAKSLALLRELGYWAEDVTAYYHPKSAPFPRKKDVLGFIDILALREGELLAVQTTDTTSVSKHRDKCDALPALALWLSSGAHFVIHGWPKDADKELRTVTAFVSDGKLTWEG